MKRRNLSTREREIYDRLTLHARAALAPILAQLARFAARNPDLPRDRMEAELRDALNASGNWSFATPDLAARIDLTMGGVMP